MIRSNRARRGALGSAPHAARRRSLRSRRPPLAGFGHPHLAPVGWSVGRPLADLLKVEPLTTAQAVAATLAVLSALGALHRRGQAHGAIDERSVGIGTDGWVRLAAGAASGGGATAEQDLIQVGHLLCRLLGAAPEPTPQLPGAAAEKAAPALVATARRLAAGVPGWTAEDAWVAIRDAAGYCGSEPRLVRALADLGALAASPDGTAAERAVTRVLAGPPLGTAAEPRPRAPRQAPAWRLPEVGIPRLAWRRPAVLPSLAEPARRLPRGWLRAHHVAVLIAVLVSGLLLGGLAGALAGAAPAVHSARAQSPRHPVAPARQAGLYARTPTESVSMFFQLVQGGKLDQAALLWKPRMASEVDLQQRFGGVRSIQLQKDRLVGENDRLGIADVAVDWVETDADGTTHEYAGDVYTATGPVLWRWDSWRVQEVVAPAGSGAGGAGGGGDGGDGG